MHIYLAIFGLVSLRQEKHIKMNSAISFCTTVRLKAQIFISTDQFDFSELPQIKYGAYIF